MPLTFLIGAGLAGDDDVLAVIFDGFAGVSVWHWGSVGVVGVLAVQGCAGGGRVISRTKMSKGTMEES